MTTDHTHHRTGDPETAKTVGDKLIRIGAYAGAAIAIITLVIMIFVAGDRYGFTPCVQARTVPLLQSHEKNDSAKWKDNEIDHKEIRSLVRQEFRVIMVYTKANMSEHAKQIAADELVNDTTISPELKIQ
jgi:hypothetical protein